jgi:hypothetical protein
MSQTNPEKILQQGKATTTTRLNIRSNPTTKADIIGVANKNIQLAFDGFTKDGENISGISKWYFTSEGNWFWSGGVSVPDSKKSSDYMKLGEKIPNKSEVSVVGPLTKKIKRDSDEFKTLIKYENTNVIFKDEEGTGADRMMTPRLAEKINGLANLVLIEWDAAVKLRITEAWDENDEHATNSIHYEGRAADITTSDKDFEKLGRLGYLAVKAGCDWVFYENNQHVHVSVAKDAVPLV